LVAAAVAVVRRREHRDDVLLVVPQISVHHQLVRACDELQAVVTVEPLRNVLPKNVAERRMGVGDKGWREGQTTSSPGVRGEEGTRRGGDAAGVQQQRTTTTPWCIERREEKRRERRTERNVLGRTIERTTGTHPAPRGEIPQPEIVSSGSDHIMSQSGPSCGISCTRSSS
jgi:hypothetical protein